MASSSPPLSTSLLRRLIRSSNSAAAAIACYLFLRWLYGTRFGLALNSIRDDEDKAEAMGLHTGRYKMVAWAIAASTASVIFSMPDSAIKRGAACEVLALEKIAPAIVRRLESNVRL